MSGGLRTAVEGLMGRARDDLAQLVSFASVHDPAQFPPEECEKAARWTADALTEAGFEEVTASETDDGSEAVHGVAHGPPGTPTVLLYCHHDVQPPLGRRRAWISPVWELTERDGRWYGRGAADCKGNIVAHLTALRALGDGAARHVKLVAEGSEEQGTGGLEAFVPEHPDLLRADAIWSRLRQLRGRRARRHETPARPGERRGPRRRAGRARCTPACSAARRRTPSPRSSACSRRSATSKAIRRRRPGVGRGLAGARLPARAVPRRRGRARRRRPDRRRPASRTCCGRARRRRCSAWTARPWSARSAAVPAARTRADQPADPARHGGGEAQEPLVAHLEQASRGSVRATSREAARRGVHGPHRRPGLRGDAGPR